MPKPTRYLNIATAPNSPATAVFAGPPAAPAVGAGAPYPPFDLAYRGGRTIEQLTFTNFYLGGASRWTTSDRNAIDAGISALMADLWCNNVIDQYYVGKPTSTMSPSKVLTDAIGDRYYTTDVEAQVTALFNGGKLGGFDVRKTVFNFLLPRGVVLVDGFRPGAERHSHETESEHDRRHKTHFKIKKEELDSKHGLGGFHGSVHVGSTTLYYSVEVYSATDGGQDNGIVIWQDSWKNVVSTLYHELVEARTDPDVADVNRTGNERLLGWYSDKGGEIGDAPISAAEQGRFPVSKVWYEATLSDGSKQPIQTEWSNAIHRPEGPIKRAHKKAPRS
jgi:hypothetical protein